MYLDIIPGVDHQTVVVGWLRFRCMSELVCLSVCLPVCLSVVSATPFRLASYPMRSS